MRTLLLVRGMQVQRLRMVLRMSGMPADETRRLDAGTAAGTSRRRLGKNHLHETGAIMKTKPVIQVKLRDGTAERVCLIDNTQAAS